MSCFKFNEDDIFINTIRAEPQYSFYIWSGSIYIDNIPHLINTKATNTDPNILGVPDGYLNLYEYNIDRLAGERIYPFVYKDGKRNSFKSITETNYATQYDHGAMVFSAYNLSASVSATLRTNISYDLGVTARKEIIALKNTLNHYAYLSPHYEYNNTKWNKESQIVKLVSIPSIFYGSSIKKGSVRLDYYLSGTLLGSLVDNRRNGELVQVSGSDPTNDGKVAGVVLYNEGFVFITGSWSLSSDLLKMPWLAGDGSVREAFVYPRWYVWATGTDVDITTVTSAAQNHMLSASYNMDYSGSTETQVMTLLAHAPYDELNYSNNPTSYAMTTANKQRIVHAMSSSYQYVEKAVEIKNVVSASYTDQEPPFEKTTYISKVAVYDENKNLIGVAKLATPVRKTDDIDYTFKIKLDI